MCIQECSVAERSDNSGAVKALETNHHEPRAFPVTPGTIEVMAGPLAYGLGHQAHGLAVDADKALDAQHAVDAGCCSDTSLDVGWRRHRRYIDAEAVEIVVLVIELVVMMGAAAIDLLFSSDAEAEQHPRAHSAVRGRNDTDASRGMFLKKIADLCLLVCVDEVDARHDDKV